MSKMCRDGKFVPMIGEVYSMYFDGDKNEQKGWRPGIVFQNDVGNKFSPNIIALPLTSSIKKTLLPTHVLLLAEDTGLKLDSVVLCENPTTISKSKIGRLITKLGDDDMRRIAYAHLISTSALQFLNETDLTELKNRALEMSDKLRGAS